MSFSSSPFAYERQWFNGFDYFSSVAFLTAWSLKFYTAPHRLSYAV